MKKIKLIGLAVCGLWVVVVGTYATQLQQTIAEGEKPKLVPLNNASCSSSSSSGDPGE